MSSIVSKHQFENTTAEVFCFDNGTEVKEYHMMIHVSNLRLPFSKQLEAVISTYNQLLGQEMKGAQPVFKRYFLSDASNQADEVIVNDVDLNYGGVVRARNQFFFTQGLTVHTHFIASTGIGGRQQDPNVLTQMDNYAIADEREIAISWFNVHKPEICAKDICSYRGRCL